MLSEKPWQTERVLQLGAALFFSFFMGGLTAVFLKHFKVAGFQQQEDFGYMVLGTLSIQGLIWLLIPIFLWLHRITLAEAFGFRSPAVRRALRLALLSFVVILPAVWLLQLGSVTVFTWLGYPPDDQLPIQMLKNAKSWWTRGYLALFAVVLAPVAEEFIFRGVLYPFIKQLGWPRLALFGVSLLFAAIHLDKATFLPLFVLALALTWLYEKTDTLFAPILVHALFNTANLLMLVLMYLDVLPTTK